MFIRTRIAVSKLAQAALCRLPSSPSLRVVLARSTLALSAAGNPCATKRGPQQLCAGALEQSARRRGEGDAGSATSRSLADLIRVTSLFRMFLTRFSTPLFRPLFGLPPLATAPSVLHPCGTCLFSYRSFPDAESRFRSQFGSGTGPSHSRATISFGSGETAAERAEPLLLRPRSSRAGSAGSSCLGLPKNTCELGGFGGGRTL